jgi:hypothetical protein
LAFIFIYEIGIERVVLNTKTGDGIGAIVADELQAVRSLLLTLQKEVLPNAVLVKPSSLSQ